MSSLTRRGRGALVVVAVCVVMAWAFGARALNAVVIPLLLSVVAAAIVVRRADRPSVRRRLPPSGFAGESGTVEVRFDSDSPMAGIVDDETGEGLATEGVPAEVTVGNGEGVAYGVTFDRRGVHELGPLSLTVTDVLGLATRRFDYPATDELVVYPRVYDLVGADRSELAMLAEGGIDREREEFDRLREYESGDSLRDIHWKSSAKRPGDELVVKEFVAENDVGDVVVAAETDSGRADAMAEAAASLVVDLSAIGVAVGLVTPDGERIDPDTGEAHRARLLERLARTDGGKLPPARRAAADVHVEAGRDSISVRIGARSTTFGALAGLNRADPGSARAGGRATATDGGVDG